MGLSKFFAGGYGNKKAMETWISYGIVLLKAKPRSQGPSVKKVEKNCITAGIAGH